MEMKSCKQCEDIMSMSVETCDNCGATNVTKKARFVFRFLTVLVPLVALAIILKVMIT